MINVFILFILIGNININKLRYVNSITYFLGSSSYINCLSMGQSAHSFKARLESDENRVKICLWLWCSSVEWHELRGGPDQGNRWSALEAFSLLILSPWACPRTGAQLKNLLSDIHQRWINSAHRSVLNAIFPPSIPLISLYNYRLNVFSCLTFWRGWKVAVKTDAMGEISQGQPAAKWRRDKKQKDTWHLNAWLLCLQQTYYSVHSCLNKVKHFKTIKCEQMVVVFRNLWAVLAFSTTKTDQKINDRKTVYKAEVSNVKWYDFAELCHNVTLANCSCHIANSYWHLSL